MKKAGNRVFLFLLKYRLFEIFTFLYYANEESDDAVSLKQVVSLKQYNTQSRILKIFKSSLNFATELYITKNKTK